MDDLFYDQASDAGFISPEKLEKAISENDEYIAEQFEEMKKELLAWLSMAKCASEVEINAALNLILDKYLKRIQGLDI